jgi:hypothetical protein
MSISARKITAFTKKVSDLPDRPSPTYSAAQIKAQFDSSPEELRVALNGLIDDLLSDYATLFSPALTGAPTAPTRSTTDNSTAIATTEWVKAQGYGGAGSTAWGLITGVITTQTDLMNLLNAKAGLNSPAFTGAPSAPTPAPGTNTTQLATAEFVNTALSVSTSGVGGTLYAYNNLGGW